MHVYLFCKLKSGGQGVVATLTLRKYSWLSFETICRVAGHQFSLPPSVTAERDCTEEGTAGMAVGLSVPSPVKCTPREGTRYVLGLVCMYIQEKGGSPRGSLNTWNWHKVIPSWKMSQKYKQGK